MVWMVRDSSCCLKRIHAPFDKPTPKGMRYPRDCYCAKGVPPADWLLFKLR